MDLLYSTGNYTQYLVITYNGIYLRKKKSLFSTAEAKTVLQISYVYIKQSI